MGFGGEPTATQCLRRASPEKQISGCRIVLVVVLGLVAKKSRAKDDNEDEYGDRTRTIQNKHCHRVLPGSAKKETPSRLDRNTLASRIPPFCRIFASLLGSFALSAGSKTIEPCAAPRRAAI
jgi:hypothetical protein